MLLFHLMQRLVRCDVLSGRCEPWRRFGTFTRIRATLLLTCAALVVVSPVRAEQVPRGDSPPAMGVPPGVTAGDAESSSLDHILNPPQEGGWSGDAQPTDQGQPGGWSSEVKPELTAPPAAPVSSAQIPVPSPPDWPLLVWDDFSDPEMAWSPVGSLQNLNQDFHENGELRIKLDGEAGDVEAFLFSVHQYRDFRVDVDIQTSATEGDVYSGLELRDQSGLDDIWYSYSFVVRSDGHYMISVQNGGPDTWIVLHEDTPSPCLRTGVHPANHLTVVAQGARMDFYANGCYLASITDDRLAEGDIGLAAALADTVGQGEVRFDNFRVYGLEPLRPVTFGTLAGSLFSRDELTERGELEAQGRWAFPAEAMTQFPAGTKQVYLYFPYEGLTPERIFRSATLLDGEEVLTSGPYPWGKEVIDKSWTGFGVLSWELGMSGDNDLPLGHYERRVYVDDILVARAVFSIGMDTSPPAPEPLQTGSAPSPARPALPPAEESFQKVAELYGQGRYAETLPYCELAMAAAPNSTYYMTLSAKCYEAAGNSERAQMLRQTTDNINAGGAARQAVPTPAEPAQPEAGQTAGSECLQQAGVLYERNEYQAAIDLLTGCLTGAAGPDKAEMYFQLGRAYYHLSVDTEGADSFDPAIDALNTALALDPNLPGAHYYLGRIWYILDEVKAALRFFIRADELDPNNPDILEYLGKTHYYLNRGKDAEDRLDPAIAALDKSLALDPNDADVHDYLGRIYHSLKDYERALTYLETATQLNDQLSAPYFYRGWIVYEYGQYEQALSLLQKGLDRKGESLKFMAYTLIGWSHYELKRYDLAEQALLQALALNQINENAYGGLGWVYQATGRCPEAIPMFEKAIELAPYFDNWKNGLAKCQQ